MSDDRPPRAEPAPDSRASGGRGAPEAARTPPSADGRAPAPEASPDASPVPPPYLAEHAARAEAEAARRDADVARRALADVHAALERRVEERTAELERANARLAEEAAQRARAEAEREVERGTLRQQLAAAEEAERRRLARELHDQLGQQLTALALGLEDARRHAAAADPRADSPLSARLARLAALSHDMAIGVRHLTLELRPPELDDMGLEHALETYVHEWAARYRVAAEVAVGGDAGPVPAEVGSALYRIAQEALTNVAKHAGARHVSVVVQRSESDVRLVVEDDGRGFDVDAAIARARAERRLGLAGMRERAALLGGTVAVESSEGQGAGVYVRFPVSHRDATPSGDAGGGETARARRDA